MAQRHVRSVWRHGALGVVLVVSVLGLSACWPSPGYDPDNTSYNPAEHTITRANVAGLVEDWVAPLDQPGDGTPVVSTGRVHVVAGDYAYGFDTRTGARVWKALALGEPAVVGIAEPSTDAFVRGSELMTSGGASFLGGSWWTTYLDVKTGELLRTNQGGGLVDSVRGANTGGSRYGQRSDDAPEVTLVVGGSGGGEARFSYQQGAGFPRTTVGSDALYASGVSLIGPTKFVETPFGSGIVWDDFGEGVRAYPKALSEGCTTDEGLQSGSQLFFACPTWVATLDGSYASAPVLSPDGPELFVTTSGGHVYALDRTDGSVLWSATLGSSSYQPALAAGRLYVPTVSGGVQVFDADGCGSATCTPAWTTAAGGAPSVAGDVLYLADSSTVRAYPAAGCGATTCEPLWSVDAGGDPGKVSVSGGRLFVSVSGRGLVSYRLGG